LEDNLKALGTKKPCHVFPTQFENCCETCLSTRPAGAIKNRGEPHWAITTITSLEWVVVNMTEAEAMPSQEQPNLATPSNAIVGEAALA